MANPWEWSFGDWLLVLTVAGAVGAPIALLVLRTVLNKRAERLTPAQRRMIIDGERRGFEVKK